MRKTKSFLKLFFVIFTCIGLSMAVAALRSSLVDAQSAPYLTLNSFSGHPGVTLQVSGGGYTPNENINIMLAGANVESTTSKNDGSFGPIDLNIPVNEPQGSLSIEGVAQTGPNPTDVETAFNSYYVQPFTPSIQVTASSNTPFNTMTVNGTGFAPNEIVAISLSTNSTTANSDSNGNFTGASLQIPNVSQGTYNVVAKGESSSASAIGYFYIGGFFPSSFPSPYYLLPQQTLSFSGSGYASGEKIDVFEGKSTTALTSFSADASGSFKNSGAIIIPFSYTNSTRVFTLTGEISNAASTDTVNIGTYYPNISPSSYSLMPGQTLNFSGNNYAGGEQINVLEGINPSVLSNFYSLVDGTFLNQGNVVIPFADAGKTLQFTLMGQTSNASASTSVSIGQYYPNVNASSYYLLPGQDISFSGSGFVPGETVKVTLNADPIVVSTITVDGKGAFKNAGSFTIPFSDKNSTLVFHLAGDESLTPNSIAIGVGSLQVQINPSSYYIRPGETFNVTGIGFVAGESVDLTIQNGAVITQAADSFGNVVFKNVVMPYGLTLPQNSNAVTLTLTGETSGATTNTNVSLGSYYPSVGSSSYYILPGQQVTFSGNGFAPNEDVNVINGKTSLMTLKTDNTGTIVPDSYTIPFGTTGSLALNFVGTLSNASANLTIGIASFYISVTADNYYVQPGSLIHASGTGFVPGEKVDVMAGTFKAIAVADKNGSVKNVDVTIPYGLSKSSVDISMTGESSLASGSTTITLAPFYPQVSPSTWYTNQGNTVTFTGSGFIPGETVSIFYNKNVVSTVTADTKGNISTDSITLPFGVDSATYVFTGNLSNANSSITIGLQGYYPGLSLSNYYEVGGSPITLNGNSFLSGESIALKFGDADLGNVKADKNGSFSYSTTVPYSTDGKKTVTATGLTSGGVGQTTFTQAPVYVSLQLGSYAEKPGSAIEFKGSGYLPNETIQVTTDRTGSNVVATFQADSNGNFDNSEYIIPNDFVQGNLSFTVTGTHSLTPQSIVFYVMQP